MLMTARYHNANFTKIASLSAWRANLRHGLLALMLVVGAIAAGLESTPATIPHGMPWP